MKSAFLYLSFILIFTFNSLVGQSALGPVLETKEITMITQTTAESGGKITSDGGNMIIGRGLVWGTMPLPTIFINDGLISNGTGIGEYDITMISLTAGTLYYVRAYAQDAINTFYGNERSFTTAPLGLNEENSSNIRLYPNPTNGIIHLDGDIEWKEFSFEIYDLGGKMVLKNDYSDAVIHVESLNTGVYIIKVQNLITKEVFHDYIHRN